MLALRVKFCRRTAAFVEAKVQALGVRGRPQHRTAVHYERIGDRTALIRRPHQSSTFSLLNFEDSVPGKVNGCLPLLEIVDAIRFT